MDSDASHAYDPRWQSGAFQGARDVSDREDDDRTVYRVVVNEEEQYSIWPEYLPLPASWRAAGKEGLRAECLAHIGEVWTDMRPLSLRRRLAEARTARAAP